MSVQILDKSLWFPAVEEANKDGLLAIGGDLSTERLILAYKSGIFPWFNEDEIPLWWFPDPRFVLFPDELSVSKSMKQIIKAGNFEFSVNKVFKDVVENCRGIDRPGQDGTWITKEMINAYNKLHQLGFAYSAETWCNGKLVGGLYGVKLGKIFFGESMFSVQSNASKFAFINWVKLLKEWSVILIDCQVYTQHLHSLGARLIKGSEFQSYLKIGIDN